MKEKAILNKIKSDITKATPNVLSKINLDTIEIKEDPIRKVASKQFNVFKILRLSISFGVLILAVVIGYNLLKNNNGEYLGEEITVTSKDKIVATYAVTGVNLVTNNNQNINLSFTNYLLTTNINSTIDNFHKYFYLIEDYFGLIEHQIEISENTENAYQYKMVVATINEFGEKTEYILYYNEEREADKDETEKEMSGILIYNGNTYNFFSEEEIENEESEVKVVIYQDSMDNRIEIEKEYELDEYQFTYEVFENDDTVLLIELEVEESEIKLKIEKDQEDYEYDVIKLSNNKYEILIENDELIILEVDVLKKEYQYTFNNTIIIK